jgi:hypothetical protein
MRERTSILFTEIINHNLRSCCHRDKGNTSLSIAGATIAVLETAALIGEANCADPVAGRATKWSLQKSASMLRGGMYESGFHWPRNHGFAGNPSVGVTHRVRHLIIYSCRIELVVRQPTSPRHTIRITHRFSHSKTAYVTCRCRQNGTTVESSVSRVGCDRQ